MHEFELQEIFRKTFSAKAVQVTEENMSVVAEWCGGTVRYPSNSDGKVRRIDLPAPGAPSTAKRAYVGYWIVFSSDKMDFRSYHDSTYRAIFETREQKAHRENLTEPEIHARNEKLLQIISEVMVKQDTATYHGDGTTGMSDVAAKAVYEISKLFI